MNILFLDQFNDLGGAQRCLLELLPAVQSLGWRGTLAVPGDGPLGDAARAMGMDVAAIDCGPFSLGRKSAGDTLRFAAQTLPLSFEIARLARQSQADLLYVNGPRLLPAVGAARSHRPVLFHAHHYLPAGPVRTLAGRTVMQLGAAVAANCVFVSKIWEPYASRLQVVYNGVAAPARRRGYPLLTSNPVIGCVGRVSPQKGQHLFIDAARRIFAAMPGARFVVQGSALFGDPDGAAYLENVRASAAGLPVEFRAWSDGPPEIWSELDLLIVPSMFPEATTRVVLEAFAAGVPVLATRCGGVEEIIEQGATGFLAQDAGQLANLVVELLAGDRQRLRCAAEAAHARWLRDFTLEAYRKRLLVQVEAAAKPVHRAR